MSSGRVPTMVRILRMLLRLVSSVVHQVGKVLLGSCSRQNAKKTRCRTRARKGTRSLWERDPKQNPSAREQAQDQKTDDPLHPKGREHAEEMTDPAKNARCPAHTHAGNTPTRANIFCGFVRDDITCPLREKRARLRAYRAIRRLADGKPQTLNSGALCCWIEALTALLVVAKYPPRCFPIDRLRKTSGQQVPVSGYRYPLTAGQ